MEPRLVLAFGKGLNFQIQQLLLYDSGCPQGCLFNIRKGNEYVDVKDDHPKIFQKLLTRLKYHGSTVFQTKVQMLRSASKSFAENHGFLSPRCTHRKGKLMHP